MDWREIPGWFDFQDLYDRIVGEARNGARFVEVGCWMGKSTVYLAQRILESGKTIALDAVDTWEGSPDEWQHEKALQELAARGKTLREVFDENIRRCGVSDVVRAICGRSPEIAEIYPDHSLDFVFIDADHHETAVVADIRAWLPKVRRGGVLAGHDIDLPAVARAVRKALGRVAFRRESTCWVSRR